MTWPLEVSREIDEGIIISEPMDWCKSPTAIVPYRLYAYQREAMNLADSVRQTSDRTHVKGSIVRASYGDEPGVGGGVLSGTHNAECTPKTWSESVTAEGRNVVRHEDEWWMNHKNTWGLLHYVKDTSQASPSDPAKIDARMLALYKAPNTATDAPPVEASPTEAPGAGSSAMSRLGTTLGIASLGYGVGNMAGQYYLGQEGNVAVGITNNLSGQVSPFSPQGQAIGGALGFPSSMSRIDEANNFLSLKAGQPVDFRTMPPDQLNQLVRQPWPSADQITKNGQALKTKTKPKPQPYPPPPPPPGFRNTGRCRAETVEFDAGSYNKTEYQRQLTMQQNALNAKGACKSYADKDAFDQKSQAQKDADRAAASRIQKSYTAAYQLANPGVNTSSLAALHRLDMVAGGSYNDIGGMGDRGINSSIGPEWTAESRGGKMKNYAKEMCQNKCPMNIILKAV